MADALKRVEPAQRKLEYEQEPKNVQYRYVLRWSPWTQYTPTGPCSVTCGLGGTRSTQRSRQCINDIQSGRGCGDLSPQIESKTESCTSSNTCPYWGAWSGYKYGRCSATCGTGVTRTGIRTRICQNDNQQGNGCGATSPQQDVQPQVCQLPLCPNWGLWSPYSPSSACSVTCGSGGIWTVQRRRVCNNEIRLGTGCGSKSPAVELKTELCSVSRQCPAWSLWTAYTFGACSATCGSGVTRIGTRTRTCLNDIPSRLACGAKSPQEQKDVQQCQYKPCPLNGQWSAWTRQTVGFCQSTCKRTVSLTRSCTNPAPSGGGQQCMGSTSNTITEDCTGGNCNGVNGQWSAWFRQRVDVCQSDCKRTVSLTRTCTNPSPLGGGLQCSGPTSNTIREVCTGGNCRTVNGQWSAWFRQRVDFCQSNCKRTVSLTRTCTNPSPSGGGQECSGASSDTISEACTGGNCFRVNGQWSAWFRQRVDFCQSSCKRTVSLTRSCTNPAPSGGGLQCSGASSDTISEDCTGGNCIRVNGQWSAWFRKRVDSCQSNCKRTVSLTRTCTNPAPSGGGLQCSGASSDTISEDCTGGNCLTVNGQWSAWFRQRVDFCQSDCKRTVSLTRTCTNPAPSGGGQQCMGSTSNTTREVCAGGACSGVNVDGQWSNWIRQVSLCQSNCKRTVSLSRTCTNPAPSGSGRQCTGSNSDTITEDCTGGSCRTAGFHQHYARGNKFRKNLIKRIDRTNVGSTSCREEVEMKGRLDATGGKT
ncbi:coadhesin-like [Gigantopelta aegis]|uniref:coadhesin-like n=1 Tax=Gigantopelta aegis TaxID=1735272 RepID=UPI001B88DB99|nr:coadhesin-like [Gigantopelta aegis]